MHLRSFPTDATAVSNAGGGANTTNTSFARDTAVYTSSLLSNGRWFDAKQSTTARYSDPCALCTVSAHAGIKSRSSAREYETSRPPEATARAMVSPLGISPPAAVAPSSSPSLGLYDPPNTTRTLPSPSTATTVPRSPLNTSFW